MPIATEEKNLVHLIELRVEHAETIVYIFLVCENLLVRHAAKHLVDLIEDEFVRLEDFGGVLMNGIDRPFELCARFLDEGLIQEIRADREKQNRKDDDSEKQHRERPLGMCRLQLFRSLS